MKLLFLLLIFPTILISQKSNQPNNKINSLKIFEIDVDNKLSLVDTTLAFSQKYNDKYQYNDSTVLSKLIEVAYPSLSLLNYLKRSTNTIMDSTFDDDITTYSFHSWCNKDTVDWDTDDKGELIYEIEFNNCKVRDTVKIDKNNRMVYYSYSSLGRNSGESYRFDDKDRLVEITSTKGHFLLYYTKNNRIDKIVEDYENIGNLIETMGSSLKREIVYKFKYE